MPKIIPSPNFVDKNAGPQCESCTHYKLQHHGPGGHCMFIMYTVDEPELNFSPKKYCPCQKFKENI